VKVKVKVGTSSSSEDSDPDGGGAFFALVALVGAALDFEPTALLFVLVFAMSLGS
jgi:MYXO-CTERM domain-containing protein